MENSESLPLNEPAKSDTISEILKSSRLIFDSLVIKEPPVVLGSAVIQAPEPTLYYSSDCEMPVDEKCNDLFGPIDMWDAQFVSFKRQFVGGRGYYHASFLIDFSGAWDDRADTALSISYHASDIEEGTSTEIGIAKEITIGMDGKTTLREVFDLDKPLAEAKESELTEVEAQKVLADLRHLLNKVNNQPEN